MNRKELVAELAKKTGTTKTKCEDFVSAFTSAVEDALKTSDKVTLVGFGTFSVTQRKAREGRNPATGAKIKIAAKKAPKFSAGKKLKDAVVKK